MTVARKCGYCNGAGHVADAHLTEAVSALPIDGGWASTADVARITGASPTSTATRLATLHMMGRVESGARTRKGGRLWRIAATVQPTMFPIVLSVDGRRLHAASGEMLAVMVLAKPGALERVVAMANRAAEEMPR